MSLNADTLIDRSYLKGQIAKWRVIAIVVIVLSGVLLTERFAPLTPHGDYIARVTIEGVIMDDILRDELFKDIKEEERIKAVLLRIDSPGGSVVAGEQLYENVKDLAAVKPVVVVMRDVAASAGYMASLPATRIYASRGTITGSIGVIMQTAEVTELAAKLGINPITIKSGPNKATPNPLEKTTPETMVLLQDVIANNFNNFVRLVSESRKMPRERVLELADGRIYTGSQAVENGLIDAIGNEKEALSWLQTEKKIDPALKVADRKPKPKRTEGVSDIFSELAKSLSIFPEFRLDGLVAIWQPKPM